MPQIITEDMIEQAAVKLLRERHHYTVLNCMTAEPDTLPDNSGRDNKKQVVLPETVHRTLRRLNPDIPEQTVNAVAEELCKTAHDTDITAANYRFYQKLRNGITVEYNRNGKTVADTLRLIDYDDVENNNFTVVSQMWIRGEMRYRRPDLILFINGFPLVFIELKNSIVPVKNAYDINLKNYLTDIPALFHYNQICVLSNGSETRLGSFSAGYEFFFEWLKTESEKENPDRKAIKEKATSLEYFIDGLCRPKNLLDYIENFILYDRKTTKIIAKNHQFLGVNNAFESFLHREEKKGKLGVFWHTQGSGKSYSMVMLARKIKHKCSGNFTFLIVTDREDLDTQIYKNFLRTGLITENDRVQPANSKALREELKTNKPFLFTLIHKFRYDKGKKYPILSERNDIVVIVDEAHRTQYKDLAENMRTGLPNAQFFAFTGTPLLGAKRLTNAWFGDYVSEYNFAESIKDNATVPLYYVKRVPEVELQNVFLDSDFAQILEEENLTDAEQRRLENHYAKELEVIKRDDRLDTIARHIVYHFPRRGFRGKGMVISVDKFTAVKMYDKVSRYWQDEIKKLNGEIIRCTDEEERNRLKEILDYMRNLEMAVVISEDADEKDKFAAEGINISIEKIRQRIDSIDENGADIEDNFKNPEHRLQLVFVCAMWLTGFDAPSVSTLYLDKPMKGHTLMQTIARANRVYKNKECGLIVDYLDVFKYLKNALAEYAADDGDLMPVKDIELLLAQLNETIAATKEFCLKQNVDLNKIIEDDDTFNNLALFEQYADKIVANDEVKNEFVILSNTVENLYESLRPDIFTMNFQPKEKDAILYLKNIIDGKIRPEKIEAARAKINELLDQSVVTSEDARRYTINESGQELDLSKIDLDELRANFKKLKNKNLEILNLRKLIEDKLKIMLKRNVTRTRFAERFGKIIDEYNAGGSQNDDFYEKLLRLMEELHEEEERHIKEELSEIELELYDLLRKEKLTAEEEKRVKLAAKELYKTLNEKRRELFIVGWQNDPQPKERIKGEIVSVLDSYLPESYDKEIFRKKTTLIFEHIVDRAVSEYHRTT